MIIVPTVVIWYVGTHDTPAQNAMEGQSTAVVASQAPSTPATPAGNLTDISRSQVAGMGKMRDDRSGEKEDCYSYPLPQLINVPATPELRNQKARELDQDTAPKGFRVSAKGVNYEYLMFEADTDHLWDMQQLARAMLNSPENLVGLCGHSFLEVQFVVRDGFHRTLVAKHTLTHQDVIEAAVASAPMN